MERNEFYLLIGGTGILTYYWYSYVLEIFKIDISFSIFLSVLSLLLTLGFYYVQQVYSKDNTFLYLAITFWCINVFSMAGSLFFISTIAEFVFVNIPLVPVLIVISILILFVFTMYKIYTYLK